MPAHPSPPLPRRIFVALLPSDVNDIYKHLQEEPTAVGGGAFATAVVIDTLRFTTTACQALQMDGQAVHVASTVEQARRLAAELAPTPLLCGERHCHRIEGFDLGNSPYEFTKPQVAGRSFVFTTTNGTRAIEAVQQVPRIVLAALVNRSAICRYLQTQTTGDLLIVCAGTDGQVTWEDVLTAGSIVERLLPGASSIGKDFISGHDSTLLAQAAWSSVAGASHDTQQLRSRLVNELSRALGGRNLLAAGYQRDLEFAALLDSQDVVPQNSSQQPRAFTPGIKV